MIQHRKGVSIAPPPCKISRTYGGLLPTALKPATSVPTASAPSSNLPPPPEIIHPKLSAPSQGI